MTATQEETRNSFPKTLPDALELGTSSGASLTILGDREESRSYEELIANGFRAATGLAERGVQRGDRVALYARTTFDFTVGAIAAWRVGAAIVPLPLPPKLSAGSAWKEHNAARIRHSSPVCMLLGRGDPDPEIEVRSFAIEGLEGAGTGDLEGPQPEDLAVIQFTSGSTASPRGVELSHVASAAQAQTFGRLVFLRRREMRPIPIVDDHHGLQWVPLYHDLGLFNFISCATYGRSLTLLPTDRFLANPAAWINEVARRGIAWSTSPNVGFALAARILEKTPTGELDLGAWEEAYCGGEPVDPNVMERFAQAAARFGFTRDRILPGYGLAEAACAVASRYSGEGLRVDELDRAALARGVAQPNTGTGPGAIFVGNGLPHPGMEIRIIDENGDPLPERSIGEIEVYTPCVMNGYFKDPEATEAVLRDGGVRTGDRGYLADGELFVTGRIKDIVIIQGQNFHAEDIERVAQDVDGVRPGSCVAFGSIIEGAERLVILAERKEPSASRDAMICTGMASRLWRVMGLRAKHVALFPLGTIPKTSSGKLQRRLTRELFEAGKLSPEGDR